MKSKKKKQINDIIENFNFEKVEKIMTLLAWAWQKSPSGIPSIKELKTRSKQMLKDVYERAEANSDSLMCCGTWVSRAGGFRAQATTCGDGNIVLSLSFEVAEWNNAKSNM